MAKIFHSAFDRKLFSSTAPFFFYFSFFLSLDSIDYINDHIGTDLSAHTKHIIFFEQKILAWKKNRKITIIELKKTDCHPRAPWRSITAAAETKPTHRQKPKRKKK